MYRDNIIQYYTFMYKYSIAWYYCTKIKKNCKMARTSMYKDNIIKCNIFFIRVSFFLKYFQNDAVPGGLLSFLDWSEIPTDLG